MAWQARRREDDISIVTSALRVQLTAAAGAAHYTVASATLAFGGMRAVTVLAKSTAALMEGMPWDSSTLDEAGKHLLDEMRVSAGEQTALRVPLPPRRHVASIVHPTGSG